MTLRHVDPRHRPGALRRAYAWFAGSRAGLRLSSKVSWKLDPWLLRATGGRIASTLAIPAGLLETTGARTGAARRNAVIYFHDGDDVIVVASNGGAPTHPSWFHNLVAHPDVVFGGVPMRATVVTDEGERARLWALADNVFAPFARYRRATAAVGRTIPIVRLVPR